MREEACNNILQEKTEKDLVGQEPLVRYSDSNDSRSQEFVEKNTEIINQEIELEQAKKIEEALTGQTETNINPREDLANEDYKLQELEKLQEMCSSFRVDTAIETNSQIQ